MSAKNLITEPQLRDFRWHPIFLDYIDHKIDFIDVSSEWFHDENFLIHPNCNHRQRNTGIKVSSIRCMLQNIDIIGPTCILLHHGFTSSTLMTRMLQNLPELFVLREPHVLTQLADLMPTRSNNFTSSAEVSKWQETFNLSMTLLSRRPSTALMSIIKPNDRLCLAGMSLANHDLVKRFLFLYSDLRSFLFSALRHRLRRRWVVNNYAHAKYVDGSENNMALITNDSDIAYVAAYLWLHRIMSMQTICASRDTLEGLFICENELISNPIITMDSVYKFLVTEDVDYRDAVLECVDLARWDSKRLGKPYKHSKSTTSKEIFEQQFKNKLDYIIEHAFAVSEKYNLSLRKVSADGLLTIVPT